MRVVHKGFELQVCRMFLIIEIVAVAVEMEGVLKAMSYPCCWRRC